MIDLYANIGMAHECDWQVIKSRVIAAAQCNADAIIMTKSTPRLAIPEHKKYISIQSKWGNLPYIEVAEQSEVDDLVVKKFNDLTKQIGIPVIWCITDSEAGGWVKEKTDCQHVKIHYDSKNDKEVIDYAINNFNQIVLSGDSTWKNYCIESCKNMKDRQKFSFYHTTNKLPAQIEELNLNHMNTFTKLSDFKIGYEGRCPGIFPDCAVVFKDVDFIEKYLGDNDTENSALLNHQEFYDFFVNMNQLEIANGKKD